MGVSIARNMIAEIDKFTLKPINDFSQSINWFEELNAYFHSGQRLPRHDNFIMQKI